MKRTTRTGLKAGLLLLLTGWTFGCANPFYGAQPREARFGLGSSAQSILMNSELTMLFGIDNSQSMEDNINKVNAEMDQFAPLLPLISNICLYSFTTDYYKHISDPDNIGTGSYDPFFNRLCNDQSSPSAMTTPVLLQHFKDDIINVCRDQNGDGIAEDCMGSSNEEMARSLLHVSQSKFGYDSINHTYSASGISLTGPNSLFVFVGISDEVWQVSNQASFVWNGGLIPTNPNLYAPKFRETLDQLETSLFPNNTTPAFQYIVHHIPPNGGTENFQTGGTSTTIPVNGEYARLHQLGGASSTEADINLGSFSNLVQNITNTISNNLQINVPFAMATNVAAVFSIVLTDDNNTIVWNVPSSAISFSGNVVYIQYSVLMNFLLSYGGGSAAAVALWNTLDVVIQWQPETAG